MQADKFFSYFEQWKEGIEKENRERNSCRCVALIPSTKTIDGKIYDYKKEVWDTMSDTTVAMILAEDMMRHDAEDKFEARNE